MLAVALAPATAARAGGDQTVRVKLPTEADAVAVGAGIERLLNGPKGIETRIPGPATDREEVRVSMGLDGSPVAVVDDQRLVLSGLGDFEFKIPGPASDVQALPGSDTEPGLRKGAVLWQGFSSGTKELGAEVTLLPDQEASRLPVQVRLSMTVDGRPLEPGRPASGHLQIRLVVENRSAVPIQVVDGGVDLVVAASTLDAIRADLERNARPKPGVGGVPVEVPVEQPVSVRTANLEAPMRISGRIELPARRKWDINARHARQVGTGRHAAIEFSALLGGWKPLRKWVRVEASVRDLRLPDIAIDVGPAPPDPGPLGPATNAATWTEALRLDPGSVSGRDLLRDILDTMWMTARLRQYDAYLGNPDPLGPARTVYRFVLAPPQPPAAGAPAIPSGGPARVAAAVVVAMVLALGSLLVWSRS